MTNESNTQTSEIQDESGATAGAGIDFVNEKEKTNSEASNVITEEEDAGITTGTDLSTSDASNAENG